MTRDQYMEEVFLKPPLVAYRPSRNLRDMLVRAKLPDGKHQRPRREVTGMRKCQNCPICPLALVKAGNKIRSTSSKYVHEVRGRFDCLTENICYVVFCKKKGCSLQYIGESKYTAQHRWSRLPVTWQVPAIRQLENISTPKVTVWPTWSSPT